MIDWEDGQPSSFFLSQFILSINQKNSSKKRVTYTRFFVIINKNMYLLLKVQIMGQSICYNMYASNAGKSGGEFFTPQEVSELLTRLAVVGKTEVNKVYDPACGSGSLLLKAAKILGKENVRQGFFGQEINLTTYNLCKKCNP